MPVIDLQHLCLSGAYCIGAAQLGYISYALDIHWLWDKFIFLDFS